MIIRTKAPSNSLYNRDYHTGLLLMKMVSKLPMSGEVVKETIINHLRNETALNVERGNISEKRMMATLRDITEIAEYPIVYTKSNVYEIENENYYYIQVVLRIPDEKNRLVSTPTLLGDISNRLDGMVFVRQGNKRIVPGCKMDDYMYCLANVSPCYNNCITYVASDDELFETALNKIMTIHNNISFNINILTDKKFNRNTIFEVMYDIQDNLISSLHNRNKYTFTTSAYDNHYGSFTYRMTMEAGCGFMRLRPLPQRDFKALLYNDMLIIYDGEKGYETSKPLIQRAYRMGVRMIEIHQYGAGQDYYNHHLDNGNHSALAVRKIALMYSPLNKIEVRRSRFDYEPSSGYFYGSAFLYAPGGRKVALDIKLRNRQDLMGLLVVPVNEKGIQHKAIEAIDKLLAHINGEIEHDAGREALDAYLQTLVGETIQGEDVLSQWFVQCTKTRHQQDDGIVKAYNQMKEKLEKEYKAISTYLNCYDFSKALPVPKITMDKKMIKNYYNTLHVEAKNVIINSINNKRISPVEMVQTNVKVLVPLKKQIIMGEYPLQHFYDSTTNEIKLCYDKMKGEVIRDKIKNRR